MGAPIPIPGRVAEALRHSTVHIRSLRGPGSGSGVVLTGGRVLTNAHVIAEGGTFSVETWTGQTVSASLLQTDRKRDLALLATEKLDAPAASLGDSRQVRAGTPVLAIGNPLGFSGAASSGVVHAAGPRWIQADVRLAPGNSGGPLSTLDGGVVGINTMVMGGHILTRTRAPNFLALAIPSQIAQQFLSRSASQERRKRMGISVRPVLMPQEQPALLILEIEGGGAAETASLLAGDLIIGVDDRLFEQASDPADELETALDEAQRRSLQILFRRGGRAQTRRVTVF